MRVIRVTYRAVFEQPVGILNPMGLKLTVPCPLEVFGTGEKWRVRELEHGIVYAKLGHFPSASVARANLEELYARQVQPWQMWGRPPGETAERLILPDEVQVLSDGRIAFRMPEDYTHILHAPTIDPASKVPPAACGAKVPAASFINNRANLEPTCKACAEVWRQHYKGRTA